MTREQFDAGVCADFQAGNRLADYADRFYSYASYRGSEQVLTEEGFINMLLDAWYEGEADQADRNYITNYVNSAFERVAELEQQYYAEKNPDQEDTDSGYYGSGPGYANSPYDRALDFRQFVAEMDWYYNQYYAAAEPRPSGPDWAGAWEIFDRFTADYLERNPDSDGSEFDKKALDNVLRPMFLGQPDDQSDDGTYEPERDEAEERYTEIKMAFYHTQFDRFNVETEEEPKDDVID
jgi:hypothetical protein